MPSITLLIITNSGIEYLLGGIGGLLTALGIMWKMYQNGVTEIKKIHELRIIEKDSDNESLKKELTELRAKYAEIVSREQVNIKKMGEAYDRSTATFTQLLTFIQQDSK